MVENPSSLAKRPELRAILLRIDLSDQYYATLASLARRVGVLLADPTMQADANIVGSLDDLLGGIYSLILARHHLFKDRPDQIIELTAVQTRAEQVQNGDVRVDGKWIAGWHFNSALFRIAAVYHRLLKLISGDPTTREFVPSLRPKAEELYRERRGADWSYKNADSIHAEVNTLKHTPQGVYDRRNATFHEAVAGVRSFSIFLKHGGAKRSAI